jgi:hypothetical protein
MAIDGVYDVILKTPMGDQKATITLKANGDKLTGTTESSMSGKNEITGKVNSNQVEWIEIAKTPMGPVKLEIKAAIDGDTFKGAAKSPFGPVAMEGKRA